MAPVTSTATVTEIDASSVTVPAEVAFARVLLPVTVLPAPTDTVPFDVAFARVFAPVTAMVFCALPLDVAFARVFAPVTPIRFWTVPAEVAFARVFAPDTLIGFNNVTVPDDVASPSVLLPVTVLPAPIGVCLSSSNSDIYVTADSVDRRTTEDTWSTNRVEKFGYPTHSSARSIRLVLVA